MLHRPANSNIPPIAQAAKGEDVDEAGYMGFGGIEILDACQLHQFPQNENKDEEGIGLNGTGVARFVGAPVGFLKELVAYASLLARLQ